MSWATVIIAMLKLIGGYVYSETGVANSEAAVTANTLSDVSLQINIVGLTFYCLHLLEHGTACSSCFMQLTEQCRAKKLLCALCSSPTLLGTNKNKDAGHLYIIK
jgi:hypothetical protein